MLLLILLFHFLLLGYASGQNGGKCEIDGIPADYFINYNLKDTDIDVAVLDTSYTGKLTDLKCTSNNANVMSYFTVSAENSKFTVRTTNKLADIDKNTPSQSVSITYLPMSCDMSCEAGKSTLQIQFTVSDTNNHAPEFLEKEYTYKVASPIMPYSDFTVYGKRIIVEDLDFSNKDVTFSVEPDDFDITTLKNEKQYTAQMIANKIIQLTEDSVTYTITATDSEETPKRLSTTHKITIQSDSSKSLDNPSFQNPSYSFDYAVDGTTVTLSPRDGPILLTTNKPESIEKSLKLTGEFKDNFTPKFNPTDNTITITATTVTSVDSFIILTLSVETDAVATTSIVVYLPGESTPKFSSHVYTGTYTVDNTVKLDKIIEVTSSRGTPDVVISGEFKDNFETKYNPSSKSYDIIVSKELSGSDLKSLTQLVLTLTATFGDEKDTSGLIIKLPEHQLQFTSALYDATYDTEGNTVTVDKSQPIAFSTAVEDVKITASGTYFEHFSITYDKDLKNYKVAVETPLPSDILPSLQEITLTLSAKDSYDFEARAVLKISIPAAPEFSSYSYQAKYPKEGTGLFDFGSALSFTNVAETGKVTISLESYHENFEVVYESNKWRLQIKKALDESTLEKFSQITTTLVATEEGNTLKGSSVLVLELPKIRPEFAEALYTVEYPKKEAKIIEFKNQLNFKNVDDGDDISITLKSYSENFLVEKSSGKWQIKIQKALDDATLKDNKELIIKMEASGAIFTKTGQSVLVLQLPEKDPDPKAPEFSDAYYLADYPESGTGKINFNPEIKFSEITDVSDISIEVSDYTSNFAIGYDTSLKLWQIEITSPLDDSVLTTESSLILTLAAKKKGVEGEGIATLVINLPSEAAEVAPIFSKTYYVATYQYEASGGPSVSLVDDISISNKDDISQISIVADEYSDNFEIKNDGKKWLVLVKSPLSDSVLKDKTHLVVSIKATDKTNGLSSSSVIDLQLPVNTEDPPQFSKTIYTAKYSVSKGKGVVTLDDPLEIVNRENFDKITITTDNYSDNFKITYNTKTKKWIITVNTNLDDSTLKSKSDIVMELTASDSATKSLGTATLVVTLPEVTIEEPPNFSSIFYQAEYNSKTTVLDADIKITNKKDASKVTITVDKAYEKYFDISLDKTTSIWQVKVIKPLPDSETKDKEDLVLTLTATETDNTAVGNAALVLTFPIKSTILFSKAQYFADYTVEDGKASMTMEDIVITNRKSSSNILLGVGDYKFDINKHFKYQYDSKKNSWKIALKDSFSEEELGDNTEFILTLMAEDQDDGSTGTTTFIIKLPSKNADDTALEFSQVYYEGAYVDTEGSPKVNLDNVIEITSKTSLDDLKVSIQSTDITKYFSLKKTSDGNYDIVVKEALPISILQNEKSLVLTLEADLAGAKSYATLVINLPEIVLDGDISFTDVLFNARYEVIKGKVTITVDPITVTTTATSENVDVSISSDSPFKTYFAVSYADGQVTLTSKTDLTEDILKGTHVIALTLVIAIKGKPDRALAVLNIEVSYDENADTGNVAFNKFLFNGKYKDGIPTQDEVISIITDQPDKIEVSVNNEYKDFFIATYSNKLVTIAKGPSEIPAEKLKGLTNIPLELLAKIKDTARTATAVINLKITSSPDVDPKSIAFSEVLYTGTYDLTGSTPSIKYDDISLITDETNENIQVEISNGFEKYFSVKQADKKVVVSVISPIPTDTLKTLNTIAITLKAQIVDEDTSSSAVLNLNIINDDNDKIGSIMFADVLHTGEYKVLDGKGKLTIDDHIQVITDTPDSEIETSISYPSEYSSYFSLSYSGKEISVEVKANLPDDVLKDNFFISLTLTAKIKDSTKSSSTVLNIKLPSTPDVAPTSIAFSEVLYTGKYDLTGSTPSIKYDDISLITDETDKNIQVEISNGFGKYFSVTQADKKVVVSVISPIPTDTLKTLNTIAITLKAQIVGKDTSSSAVLNLNIVTDDKDKIGSIMFADVLHTGEYKVLDGKGKLTIDDHIQVITDTPDSEIETSISYPSEYSSYFSLSYSGKEITVEVKANLPDDVLKDNFFISLTLTAKIKDSTKSSSTVLNIKLPSTPDVDPTSIAFADVLYTGKYDLTGSTPSIKYDDISLITDETDKNIQVEISNGFEKYFSVKQADKKVVVSVISPIPTDTLKTLNTIAITLKAQIVGKDTSSSAVLNLDIIRTPDVDTTSIAFSEVLYTGKYDLTGSTPSINYDDISLITDETDENIQVEISNGFQKYFSVKQADKKVVVSVISPIPTDTLKTLNTIAITLKAQIVGEDTSSSAVLNLNIITDDKDKTGSIMFAEVLHTGEYKVLDGKGKLTIDDHIQVITDTPDSEIETSISYPSEYSSYFSLSYSGKEITVEVKANLPDDVLKDNFFISLTLTAKIKDSTKSSSTVLNIKLPSTPDVDPTSIAFADVLYTGKYDLTGSTPSIKYDDISLITDETDKNIQVEISNGFDKYFSVKQADKKVVVSVISPIPTDTLKTLNTIAITLKAQIVGKDTSSSAVLNLDIIRTPDVDTTSIAFSEVLYTGKYDLTGSTPSIKYDDISLITDETDKNIQVEISNGFEKYFSVTQADKKVVVSVISPIPTDTLKTLNTIAITLKAQIVGKDTSSSAVLNLNIINDDNDKIGSIMFADVLHTGEYKVLDGKGKLTIDDHIQVITDTPDSEIETSISYPSEYSSYFSLSYSSQEISVEVKTNLPDDVLKDNFFISLTLTAKIKDSTKSSSTVLNIKLAIEPDTDTASIAFSEVLYTGTYDVTGTSVDIKYDDILLITDETDENIQVEISNGFKTYFSVKQKDKKVVVSLTSPIPTDTIHSLTTIAITITAQTVDSSKTSSAVLNLRIITDDKDKSGSILFPEVLHTGKYSVADGKGTLALDGPIQVITDTADSEIETSISDASGYSSYFSLDYSSKTISVNVKANLPDDVLKHNSFISLTITASIKSTTKTASTVLNIKLDNGKDDTTEINFTSFIYNGEYQIEDNKASIRHDPITVETDQADDFVMQFIENEYASFFFMNYADKHVTLDLKNEIPSSTLQKLTNIPVELKVQIKNTQHSAFAVLNLKVIGDKDSKTDVIAFQKVLYNGKYNVSDNEDEPKFTVEDIKVITESLETDIEITAWDDYNYNQYFNFSYNNNKVLIALIQQIPANVYKNVDYIPITLTAKIKSSGFTASTVLNIEIDYLDNNDDNKGSSVDTTGYIAAIVVLSIVLIALLSGAAGFYYIKFRNRNYSTMEDDDFGRIRFDKQSRTSTKSLGVSSLEERRPTGFNFDPITEGDLPKLETSPDPAENTERRKSVAFNENVQKLEIDGINDDDVEKALGESGVDTSL